MIELIRFVVIPVCLMAIATPAAGVLPFNVFVDPPADAVVRRFDGGVDGPPPGQPALPDLLSYDIGAWSPDNPADSLYRGQWDDAGMFLRLDLVFDGLVQPPGLDFASLFLFGDNPLLGFVEIDMDANVSTGGEIIGPQFRYLGAAARFGGMPSAPRFTGRTALDQCPGSFDADISSGPYFPERSGEEFHLAFLWGQVTGVEINSNGDFQFEAGESWLVTGPFFHRAHGYDDFILLCCSNGLPGYNPSVTLLFSHGMVSDRTTVSLVYPLTNAASAAQRGEVVQANDCCADNQNSIAEALEHLELSAVLASSADRQDVNFDIIADWETQVGDVFVDPDSWDVSAIIAGAYVDDQTFTTQLAYSDLAPNILSRDFNGDGVLNLADTALFDAFLSGADGGSCDDDATTNGEVVIANFGNNFNVFDVNYDGVINGQDRPTVGPTFTTFDQDGDGDVDLADHAVFQQCIGAASPIPPICEGLDFDGSTAVDDADMVEFIGSVTGPAP